METLYLFGVRESELLSMNAKDVEYDGVFTRITVRDSKTKPREVIHKGRCDYLMSYFENYQIYKNNPKAPLWSNQNGNRMTDAGMLYLIRSATKKADIKRKITPHDFRHTSISNDKAKGVPNTHIETKHGLTHGTAMWRIYDHNKNTHYEKYLKEKEGETKPTYELLEKQKETLEKKHEVEITDQKRQIEALKEVLQVVADNMSGLANANLRKNLKEILDQI